MSLLFEFLRWSASLTLRVSKCHTFPTLVGCFMLYGSGRLLSTLDCRGVVMYVTLHGVLPFTNKELKIAEHHNLPALCLRSSLSLACGRLLRNLLTYSAVIRPDLSQVLQDDWLCDGASMFPYRTVRVLPNHCAEPTLILKRQVQFTMPKVKSLLDGHKPEATRREKCQCQEEGTLGLSKVRAAIKSKEIHARYQRAQKLIS